MHWTSGGNSVEPLDEEVVADVDVVGCHREAGRRVPAVVLPTSGDTVEKHRRRVRHAGRILKLRARPG